LQESPYYCPCWEPSSNQFFCFTHLETLADLRIKSGLCRLCDNFGPIVALVDPDLIRDSHCLDPPYLPFGLSFVSNANYEQSSDIVFPYRLTHGTGNSVQNAFTSFAILANSLFFSILTLYSFISLERSTLSSDGSIISLTSSIARFIQAAIFFI